MVKLKKVLEMTIEKGKEWGQEFECLRPDLLAKSDREVREVVEEDVLERAQLVILVVPRSDHLALPLLKDVGIVEAPLSWRGRQRGGGSSGGRRAESRPTE